MANSARYRLLVRRLSELRNHLLPKVFSPTGQYSARQLDRARGYRLLAHAEIEAFVEDAARAAVMAKLQAWRTGRNVSQLLFSFIAAYHSGFGADERDQAAVPGTSRVKPDTHIDEVVTRATNQYNQKVSENHGVRTVNLKRVLLPLGIDFSALDATWLTNMDEFGKRRGEIAHTSAGAQRDPDPRTEFQYVQDLLAGLKDLDKEIQSLAS